MKDRAKYLMRAFVKCSRIFILCLLCISVIVPVFLVSNRLKQYSDASKEFVKDLSIIKRITEAQSLIAIEQEEREGFREPPLVVYEDDDTSNSTTNFSSDDDTILFTSNDDAKLAEVVVGGGDFLENNATSYNAKTEDGPKRLQEDELPLTETKKELDVEEVQRYQDKSTMSKTTLDEKVNEMKDQVIRAKAYLSFTAANSSSHFVKELKFRIKEVERALSQTNKDHRLSKSSLQKMKAMETTLSKASRIYPDCAAMVKKLRALTYNAEEQVRSHRSQETFLKELGARTIPKGLHCLSMRLTAEFFALEPKKRELPNKLKLNYPDHYHFAIFSDNILACSVVVNSTISTASEPEKIVFHVVTDALNFPAMTMWFLSNPPDDATINVESIEDFQWLSAKYNATLRKDDSVDPRYNSELNHLRFYLPDIFPRLNKIVLLDHDVVVRRDLRKLWKISMRSKVNGAVQTCKEGEPSFRRMDMLVNFTDPIVANKFDAKVCTWAFGINVFDLKEWRRRKLTEVYHKYLRLGTQKPLWKAGSLPIGWITFYKNTVALDKRWQALGLGYDSSLNREEINQAAVLHFDGILKPWLDIGIEKYKHFWKKHVDYEHPHLQQCNIQG